MAQPQDDLDLNTDDANREELVNNVLELQDQLRALISRVDSAKADHHSLLTENQMLQKYINNSLTSTAVFGAAPGVITGNQGNKS
ncbi:hypothetical protein BCR42DRAFT_381498 [Absidia repens]|uniref:Uncharacterized protein n=1 Tax=Absidia repens TaxID=90262 RepID=A0A1X2I5Q5_9FUNG|nr:hypothetical protein BCR42DRAFT_381498 [Absidia repens]